MKKIIVRQGDMNEENSGIIASVFIGSEWDFIINWSFFDEVYVRFTKTTF